jgi:hypothetical protein
MKNKQENTKPTKNHPWKKLMDIPPKLQPWEKPIRVPNSAPINK